MTIKKINISGEIGWDVYASDIETKMNDANGQDLEIILNTPGGFVSEGSKIDELLLEYKKTYKNSQILATVIEAQSYGSYLLTNPAFDLRVARKNSIAMIHNPLMGIIGDYKEMKKASDLLERRAALYAERYNNVMKKDINEVRSIMDEETYFIGGQELLNAGLVDEVVDEMESLEDKMSLRAKAEIRMENLKVKIKNTKEDFEKIAAITKKYDNKLDNNKEENKIVNANKPATGGQNNNMEDVLMNLAELKEKHPEIYAEALEAGKIEGSNSEKERVKSLLEMKNHKDFENLEMVHSRIDEGILNGESLQKVELGIMALLKRNDVQAAIDTNEIGEINTPKMESVSGEVKKEVDNRREF